MSKNQSAVSNSNVTLGQITSNTQSLLESLDSSYASIPSNAKFDYNLSFLLNNAQMTTSTSNMANSMQKISQSYTAIMSLPSNALSQLPVYPSALDALFPDNNFTFATFIQEVVTYREQFIQTKVRPTTVPSTLQAIGTMFQKPNLNNWLLGPFAKLFTYSDYFLAYAARATNIQNNGSQDLICFMTDVCYFYWSVNNLSKGTADSTFQDFISHTPYDYSRPNSWAFTPDYVSYAEALQAVNTLQESGSTPQLASTIQSFQLQFPSWWPPSPPNSNNVPLVTSIQQMTIPYNVYSDCFDSISSSIQPWDIEICVYYCLQQQLDLQTYVCVTKATEGQSPTPSVIQPFPCLPSLKWYDEFNWNRLFFIVFYFYWVNSTVSSEAQVDLTAQWPLYVQVIYTYKSSTQQNFTSIGYQGITITRPYVQFGYFHRVFCSFAGYPLYVAVSQVLVSSMITSIIQTWNNNPFPAGTSPQSQAATKAGFQATVFPLYKSFAQLSTIVYNWQTRKPPTLNWNWNPSSNWINGASTSYLSIINTQVTITNDAKTAMNSLKAMNSSNPNATALVPLGNPGVLPASNNASQQQNGQNGQNGQNNQTSQNTGTQLTQLQQAQVNQANAQTQAANDQDSLTQQSKVTNIIQTAFGGLSAVANVAMISHMLKGSKAESAAGGKNLENMGEAGNETSNRATNTTTNENPAKPTVDSAAQNANKIEPGSGAEIQKGAEGVTSPPSQSNGENNAQPGNNQNNPSEKDESDDNEDSKGDSDDDDDDPEGNVDPEPEVPEMPDLMSNFNGGSGLANNIEKGITQDQNLTPEPKLQLEPETNNDNDNDDDDDDDDNDDNNNDDEPADDSDDDDDDDDDDDGYSADDDDDDDFDDFADGFDFF